jgi:hypothetical protein
MERIKIEKKHKKKKTISKTPGFFMKKLRRMICGAG